MKASNKIIYAFMAVLTFGVAQSYATSTCVELNGKIAEATDTDKWKNSYQWQIEARKHFPGLEHVFDGIAVALLSRNNVMLTGNPGAAKTMLSKLVARHELQGVPLEKKKMFLQGFHQLINEGIIVGFPRLNDVLVGKGASVDRAKSLSADDVIFGILDEWCKAPESVVMSALSLLNSGERRLMLGDEVVNTLIRTIFMTTNKNPVEFLDSFSENRVAAEASLDRSAVKILVPHIILDNDHAIAVSRSETKKLEFPPSFLSELTNLIHKVEIDPKFFPKLSQAIFALDRAQQKQMEAHSDWYAANQFSIRSDKEILNVLKAAFIFEQMMAGTPLEKIRWKIMENDLPLISYSALYMGPGKLQARRYPSKWQFDTPAGKVTLPVQYEPTARILSWVDPVTMKLQESELKEGAPITSSSSIKPISTKNMHNELVDGIKKNGQNPDVLQIEENEVLARYLKLPIEESDKDFLKHFATSRTEFINILNRLLTEETSQYATNLPKEKPEKASIPPAPKDPKEILKWAWQVSQNSLQGASHQFQNFDHVLREWAATLLSQLNIGLFGGPGSAKTLVAVQGFEAELAGLRLLDPETTMKLYQLQFHPTVFESRIRGYEELKKRVDTGEYELNVTNTLSDPANRFALLDEVHNGNSGTLSATLGPLNPEERAAYNEKEITLGLRSAALTSNKTPADIEAGFPAKDIKTAKALNARVTSKTFVPNKFFSEAQLTSFFANLNGSLKMEPTAFTALTPLLEKTVLPKNLQNIARDIQMKFLTDRLAYSEATRKAHLEDPETNPYYWVPAASAAARDEKLGYRKAQAAYLADQMMNSVAFEKLNTKPSENDITLIPYLNESLLYSSPIKLAWRKNPGNSDLELYVKYDPYRDEDISHFSKRDRSIFENLSKDAEAYVRIANNEINRGRLLKRKLEELTGGE